MAEVYQTNGMRRPGGRVRHIVQLDRPVPRYTRAFALCGVPVETMGLADTLGGTCRTCLRHPLFNGHESPSCEDQALGTALRDNGYPSTLRE